MTGRPLTSFGLTHLFALLGIAALVACGSSDRPASPDEDSSETGGKGTAGKSSHKGGAAGTTSSNNSGGSSGSSTSSSSSDKGGGGSSSSGSAGSDSKAGSAGSSSGSAGKSGENGSGSGSAGAAGKSGGSAGSSNKGGADGAGGSNSPGGGGGAAGTTEIICANTDKSVLPVAEDGWVDKTCNNCGIQGAFYWYADANTTKNLKCGGGTCKDGTPPWSASSKGFCISGKATGDKEDWGAGIGLSLADSGGDDSVKGSFDATGAACGKITGFDLTLSGNTNGMPLRIGFATSKDGSTISPFIEVPDPGGKSEQLSGSSQVVITNAKIPTDWKSKDPSPPDPSKLYDLQIQVATDTADKDEAFEVCVTDVKPYTGGGGGSTGSDKTCKSGTAQSLGSDTSVKDLGSYGFQTNANAVASGSVSTQAYSGSGCAALVVSTSGVKSSGDLPAAYPSLIDGWHWDKGMFGSYKSAKQFSSLSSVKSSMSFTPPTGNKWDVAYDIWLDPDSGIKAPKGGSLEVMVWMDYSGEVTTNPIGEKTGNTLSVGGTSWEVWSGTNGGGWKVVSYRRGQSTAAVTDLDLLSFIKDAVKVSGVSGSSYLLGVQAGFELFDAKTGGSLDYYTCSIN